MRALSIRQPWAWAIMAGMKPVENRTWSTKHRGLFLVHAGAKIDKVGVAFCAQKGIVVPEQLPVGALLGTVELTDVVTVHPSAWFSGPYGFEVKFPQPFKEPFPYKGRLGFFEVPNEAWEVK